MKKKLVQNIARVFTVLMCTALLLLCAACMDAVVAEDVIIPDAIQTPAADVGTSSIEEPMTWGYLATIAGASTLTLLIVQFFKMPLDKVWHIPTRLLAYIIAWAILLLGTHFTGGLTLDTTILAAANALLAAMAAMGAYEVTFAKLRKE